jgi:hypothetical protein
MNNTVLKFTGEPIKGQVYGEMHGDDVCLFDQPLFASVRYGDICRDEWGNWYTWVAPTNGNRNPQTHNLNERVNAYPDSMEEAFGRLR